MARWTNSKKLLSERDRFDSEGWNFQALLKNLGSQNVHRTCGPWGRGHGPSMAWHPRPNRFMQRTQRFLRPPESEGHEFRLETANLGNDMD